MKEAPAPAPDAARVSAATASSSRPWPAPPYSCGTARPSQPPFASSAQTSSGQRLSSSQRSQYARSWRAPIAPTPARTAIALSGRLKSMRRLLSFCAVLYLRPLAVHGGRQRPYPQVALGDGDGRAGLQVSRDGGEVGEDQGGLLRRAEAVGRAEQQQRRARDAAQGSHHREIGVRRDDRLAVRSSVGEELVVVGRDPAVILHVIRLVAVPAQLLGDLG